MIAIQIFLSYILFFLAILTAFYLPGVGILSLIKINLSKTEKPIFAWAVGYSTFLFHSYISAWIHLPFLSLLISLFLTLFVLLKKRNVLILQGQKINWGVVSVIIVGSVSFVSMSFLSGLETQRGMQFVGSVNSTDAVMHVARIKTQLYAFPPIYTGFVGYAVRGYHYFYDFLLSRFTLFYHFSPEDLYYRLFPLFISVLYGVSIYLFSTRFTKKKIEQIWILFFAYFAQSFGFLLSLFTKKVDIANGMGLVQPQQLVLDPSSTFSIALLLVGCYILLEKRLTFWHAFLAGLILGLLAQLKVYAGIVAVGMLVLFMIYRLILRKEIKWYILTLVIVIALTALTYFPNNLGVGKLIYSPFFLYETFIKQNPLFASWNWDIRMLIYTEHHNIPRILFMYIEAAVLFWVLTLGSRIIILLKTPVLLQKKFWTTESNILLVLLIAIPTATASIFVQSISIFDTVQFLWIVGVLFCIPTGIFYGQLVEKLPRWGKYLIVIPVVFLSLGSFISDENTYIFHPNYITVSPSQMKIVRSIETHVLQSSYLVVAPSYEINKHGEKVFKYYGAPLLADLTGIRTYYEYEIPVFFDEKKVVYRKSQMENITLYTEKCDGNTVREIMKHTGTSYLLTESGNMCQQIPHMKKIATGDNWTFWIVK